MAEPRKPAPLSPPAKVEAKVEEPASPKLAPAGASGEAGVQNLLAQRYTHASNGDTDAVAEIDRQLAELGLTAQ